ncbi:unnamed protein product [Microthlaspi erraticum]|uniref:Uncharacterized protein n=1 Tax=Microthlaspi erraticum TaxID=1685480 RepID=A0A6D2I9D6_9BRAS|nr:unnamed protein product [Microthlaspi erraticum]
MNKVSQWVDKKVGYIHNLEKNLATLEANMADLKAKRNDLLRKATREEEDRGRQKLEEFQVWHSKVEFLENRVDGLLDARGVQLQRLCLCGFCSKSLRSSYRYGKKVFLSLTEVEELRVENLERFLGKLKHPRWRKYKFNR